MDVPTGKGNRGSFLPKIQQPAHLHAIFMHKLSLLGGVDVVPDPERRQRWDSTGRRERAGFGSGVREWLSKGSDTWLCLVYL